MNRCLHITIQENADALPPRAAAYLPGRAGTDPGTDLVMPRPEDPAADLVMPRPEDPAADTVMPRPENPDRISYPSAAGGYRAAVAAVGPCCCAPSGQEAAAPGKAGPHPFIRPRDYSGFVIVRLAEGVMSDDSRAESLWALAAAHRPPLEGLTAVLELGIPAGKKRRKFWRHSLCPPGGVFVSRPLVELQGPCKEPLPRKDSLSALRALEKRAATTAFPPLHSLASYWRLDLRERPDLAEEVVERLNHLAEVDLAYRELAATDPRVTTVASGQVFAEDQGYLDDAPLGISASWAWRRLDAAKSAATVTLCDLEQGWHLDHQDLRTHVHRDLVFGANRAETEARSGNHGTAVLGQLAAVGTSPFGIRGAAAGIGKFVVASHYLGNAESHSFPEISGNVVAAITQALSSDSLVPLEPGDILLLEVQRGLLPAEADEADFEAIRLATALGIIVIEAAGNGGFDLDSYTDPASGRRSLCRGDSRFRDSGAILVGAARAGLPHDRALFSNYGSRLDCFGWGENVTTCGYGNLAGEGETDSYTNTFSGTSSASPIVAGAAVLLQALHQTYSGERLEPQAMRTLLADPATGTRQGPNVPGHIGIMPDLRAIARDLLQLVPDVYLRRSLGDDGAAPIPSGEAGSCPDILVCPEVLSDTRVRYGEGSGRENTHAPGGLIRPGEQNNIYVRLHNRGLGVGDAQVQLFASPAATLITPERWIPVGAVSQSLSQGGIPQGDTLVVAEPLSWQPPACSISTWSFLAVLTRHGEGPCGPLDPPWFDRASGLPPGPPYFDWAEYRAFLRRPEVAWRNTYRVTDGCPLTFSITGTPDRARAFDFEVIQRLPAGARVTLHVNDALLAAKLRQRQPWLGGEAGRLVLPKRPRTMFQEVQLAAGAREQATFTVQARGLLASHSLALRQIWRGEEVGRITWYFGPDA